MSRPPPLFNPLAMAAGGGAGPDLGSLMEANLVRAAKVMEEQIDAEIEKMEKLDEDGLEAIRKKRVRAGTSIIVSIVVLTL